MSIADFCCSRHIVAAVAKAEMNDTTLTPMQLAVRAAFFACDRLWPGYSRNRSEREASWKLVALEQAIYSRAGCVSL